MNSLWIPVRLPGLNDLVSQNVWAYTKTKKRWGETAALFARVQGFEPGGTCWTFFFLEPNRRRDPDNFIGAGVKLILDGLQKERVLDGDGWKSVTALTCYWDCSEEKTSGVLVHAGPRPLDRDEALGILLRVSAGANVSVWPKRSVPALRTYSTPRRRSRR